MKDDFLMSYCCCCGKIYNSSGICNFCNTKLVETNIDMSDFYDLPDEERNKWRNEIFETKIKTSPLYDAQKMQVRIMMEQNDEMEENIQHIPKCPICNSTNIHKIFSANKVGSVALFGIFSVGHVSKTWKCDSCGSKF